MNRILLIVQREYLTRVRKKSFILVSILGPLFMSLLFVIPVWLTTLDGDQKVIQVIDESGYFQRSISQIDNNIRLMYTSGDLDEEKVNFVTHKFDALLYIPKIDIQSPSGIVIYHEKSLSSFTKKSIERALEKEIERIKLLNSGISQEVLKSIRADMTIQTINLSDSGEQKTNTDVASAVGYICAFVIYIFTFYFGSQVMRGVMEEKTNRIVEVIISSVKPFELMVGKILGIAGVAATQFLIWVVLGTGIMMGSSTFLEGKMKPQDISAISSQMQSPDQAAQMEQIAQMGEIMNALDTLNLPYVAAVLLFYFIGGYVLYGALFAAIGAAVDNETDSQQFMFPVTIPLIVSIMLAMYVIKEPDGPVAFWGSMIPFTSPVIMMVRLPFGVPVVELLLSMLLLVGGFVGVTWVAGRIYRVGILMYGKKITWQELGKWFFYKA